MNLIGNNITTVLTYSFLFLAAISLWLPKFKKISLWWLFLIAAIIFGLISHRIELLDIAFIFLLWVSAYLLRDKQLSIFIRVTAAMVLFALAVGLEAHLFPGFHNLSILNHVKISPDAIPFSLYLNFDKAVVGIIILGLLHSLISTKNQWITMFKATAVSACAVIVALSIFAFVFKFIHFDLKLPHSLFIWMISNLLITCLAEEALFRGFIQKYLCVVFKRFQWGNIVAILVASILFGLAHHTGGIEYMFLASMAGLGYGWVYFHTKRIEASILTHFSLNLIQFLFFTYPALSGAFK